MCSARRDLSSLKFTSQLPPPEPASASLRELADTVPALLWIAGRDGYAFVNRAYLDFLGASLEQVVGQGWKDYLAPEDRDSYLAAYQQAMQSQEPLEQEVRYRRSDGGYCWMKSVAMPRYAEDGEFAGLSGSMVDITRLKEAQLQLEQADQAKNAFIAILAHELRNPLAALTNAVELAFAPDLPPDKHAMGETVLRRQLAGLNRMLDDLLDISRVTQGRIRLRKDELEVQGLIQHVLETFESSLGPKEMPDVTLDLPREPIVLWADAVRMEQVLNTLLSNAYKFSAAPRRIMVSAAEEAGQVLIRVRDNGQGISAELLPHLFELFMQADQSTRRRHGGLGLGLALSKRLIELHGGTLTVATEGKDRGSEFTLCLPKGEAPQS
jgi:two-component system, chemotaxis family, CheB/CheR fusion protein